MRKLLLVAILVFINGLNILFIEHCYAYSNEVDYGLQEKCGNKADNYFRKEFGNGFMEDKEGQWVYNYSNHYNKKLNKCFVIIRSMHLPTNDNEKIFMSKRLIDINKNKYYGGYAASTGVVKPTQCEVQGMYCNSEGEWDLLVNPYMEQ